MPAYPPEGPRHAAHAALNRLLQRLEADTPPVWRAAEALVDRTSGRLVVDATPLDNPAAREVALVHRPWSGNHRRIVAGRNLVTLVWRDDTHAVPCDYRLCDAPHDGLTKNDHFRAMLPTAKERGWTPRSVWFARWDRGLANLKPLRTHGWHWRTRLKANRLVTPDGAGNRPRAAGAIADAGTRVHLKGDGCIRVVRIDTPDGDTEYWATRDLLMTMDLRTTTARQIWTREPDTAIASKFVELSTACCAASARTASIAVGRFGRTCAGSGTGWKLAAHAVLPNSPLFVLPSKRF